MTTIIGVLNSQGIAIAADSAVTITSGDVKKVYHRSNKLFTLSKFNPVGIAIYGSAQFAGIPWETLIKMYRKQLKQKKFGTVEDHKNDFLKFLVKNIDLVTSASKDKSFFSFALVGFNELKSKIIDIVESNVDEVDGMDEESAIAHITPLVSAALDEYEEYVSGHKKIDSSKLTYKNFLEIHEKQLAEIPTQLATFVSESYKSFTFSDRDTEKLCKIFFELSKVEYIFESNSGLVFMGFGEKEVYPSSQLVTIGSIVGDILRYKIEDPYCISPGVSDANIIPYAQGDVTWTVLNGIDPAYNEEVKKAVSEAFTSVASEVGPNIADPTNSARIQGVINGIPDILVAKLDSYRNEAITRPLVSVLGHMDKEDMAEMAESLVSITSLKRKFTQNSSDESVGGPVDVAIITKGDGFVWMKRKHYFEPDLNKGFMDQYYK